MNKCLLLLLILISNSSFAQNPLVKEWDYRFGGTNQDFIFDIKQTLDEGYILAGTSFSDSTGDKTQACWDTLNSNGDYWIIKIDSVGIKQWDKTFGGTKHDQAQSIVQTSDGGYILGGYSKSGQDGDKTQASFGVYDYWIIKLDSYGNSLWDKSYGGDGDDYLFSIDKTEDGGCILGGFTYSGISGTKTQDSWGSADYWIIKIDSMGNQQWDKRFGGTGYDQLYSVRTTIDKGYVLCGYSYITAIGDQSQSSWGQDDYWIVKVDSLGAKIWDKRFGGENFDEASALAITEDGGYVVAGKSASDISGDKTQSNWGGYDYWVIKIDSLGNKIWDKDYGGTLDEDEFRSLNTTQDGNYLLGGTSYSMMSGDKSENNLGNEQSWIFKIDTGGNKIWDKTLLTATGMLDDETGLAIQSFDGCYVMANCTSAGIGGDKTQPSWGGWDYWIIKFCDTTIATSALMQQNNSSISIYPNPSSGNFTLELLQSENVGEVSIDVVNTLGQKVFSFTEKISPSNWKKEIDLHDAASGVYFIEIKSQNVFLKKKIVVAC